LVSQFPAQELTVLQVIPMVTAAAMSSVVGIKLETSAELALQTDPSHSQFASAEQVAEEEINEHSA
jgi:hypothetical protein